MNSTTCRFIRQYVEMVVAMFLGMLILGVPGELALHALGSSMLLRLDEYTGHHGHAVV
jgi:hypothetical protein